jgi:hypothetical protein
MTEDEKIALIQKLYHSIKGDHIYAHEAVAYFDKAQQQAATLAQLDKIQPQWIHDYLVEKGWHHHKDYSHWQFTAPRGRWKVYASFCLKMKKKDATAEQMWRAVTEIAKHEGGYSKDVTRDMVISRIFASVSAIEALGSVVRDSDA